MDVLSLPNSSIVINTNNGSKQNENLSHGIEKDKVVTSGIQLRTSARVLKKQKLDLEASSSAEKKDGENVINNGSTTVSSIVHASAGPWVRPNQQSVRSYQNNNHGSQSHHQTKKRVLSTLWSLEEKALFFEALNEMGKDFDGMERYLNMKSKKGSMGSGPVFNKTKLQTKNFYSRMFLKLSKHVTLPEVVKKSTQEVYTLINFGELRKRVGHITEKNAIKFKELIYCGSTQVRVRGKTWRVKTPVCRALRKLNHLEDSCDEIRLPPKVDLYIRGRTNRDCMVAESRGQNARLKASLPTDLPLSALLTFLETKWSVADMPESSSMDHINDSTGNGKVTQSNFRCNSRISVGPPPTAHVVQSSYRCGQLITSASISLLAHQARQGQPLPSLHALIGLVPPVGVRAGKTWAKWHHEGEPPADHLAGKEVLPPPKSQPVESASGCLGSIASGITSSSTDVAIIPPIQIPLQPPRETKEEFERRVRAGWNRDNSLRTRIADLYIIFGGTGRLDLEYWWDDSAQGFSSFDDERSALSRLLTLARMWSSGSCSNLNKGVEKCWACGMQPSSSTPLISSQTTPSPPPTVVKVKAEVCEAAGESHSSNCATTMCPSTVASATDSLVGRFLKPLLPAMPRRLSNEINPKHFQSWFPKYCYRRGRSTTRNKGVVVKRMLPLLPKGRPNMPVPPAACSVVTLQVVAQGNGANRAVVPSNSTEATTNLPTLHPVAGQHLLEQNTETTSKYIAIAPKPQNEFKVEESSAEERKSIQSSDDADGEKGSPSPLLPQIFNDSNEVQVNSFSGLLGGGSSLKVGNTSQAPPCISSVSTVTDADSVSTPPPSPTAILREGESQWLNSEVVDFSLSSFLNHLESPLKSSPLYTDTRISVDVDSQFQSMMMESSLDYTAKFADLAAKITGNSTAGQPNPP